MTISQGLKAARFYEFRKIYKGGVPLRLTVSITGART